MAADLGHPAAALSATLFGRHERFNVFQLMRLLLRKDDGGGEFSVGRRLRFRAELGAGFQSREIARLQEERAARTAPDLPARVVLRTPNYCVASELGPLPAPFLEWVREQQRGGSEAMAAFFDLFNQRIHVLRYDLKQRSLRALDSALPERSRHAAQLAALIGLAQPSAQAQIPLPPRAWLGMAGLFANNRRSAEVIATVMSRYLGVRTRVLPLRGQWRAVEPAQRIALGRRNHRLGVDSLLGSSMWDQQAAVRLEVGRMPFARALALLPLRASQPDEAKVLPATRYAAFASLVQLLLDRRHDCEVHLHIATASIPPARLSVSSATTVGLRLGQTAWLIGGMLDAADASNAADAANPPAGDTRLHGSSIVRFRIDAYADVHAGAAA